MKHFNIYLRRKITETDLYIQELVLRKDLEGRDRLVLYSQACLLLLWKFALPEEAELKLGYDLLPLLKTAYTGMKGRVMLSGSAGAFSTVFAQGLPGRISFGTAEPEVLRTVYSRGTALAELTDELLRTNPAKYFSARDEAVLTGTMNSALWHITKYGSVEHLAKLLTAAASCLAVYTGGNAEFGIESAAAPARTVHFRSLGELFPQLMEDLEPLSLEELIQVVLE